MIINIITKQRPSRHFNNKIMERLRKHRLGKMITQKQRYIYIYIYLTLNLEADTGHLAWSTTLTHSFQLA